MLDNVSNYKNMFEQDSFLHLPFPKIVSFAYNYEF